MQSQNVEKNPPANRGVYSVGHSNHDTDTFLALLQAAGIGAVADVRSSPYSRRLPHFNGPALAELLRKNEIAYVFLGDLLGGRPADPDLYDADGRVDYERVRATEDFHRGLERLVQGADRFAVAMMCGEADPLDCHRGLMITPALLERSVAPLHLRRDGTLETTAQLEGRLLAATGHEGLLDGLFAPVLGAEERRQVLAQAYRTMARRKAFRRDIDPE
jgi:uncharacterized protein (DUF488 family)